MEIVDRCQNFGAGERLGHQFMICNIDVLNVVLLEQLENVLRELKHSVASCMVWHHSDPNCDRSSNCLSVTICILLILSKVGKVNGGKLDTSIVEEFNNLGINVSW